MRIASDLEPLEQSGGFRLQPQCDHLVELMFKAVEDDAYIDVPARRRPHTSIRDTGGSR